MKDTRTTRVKNSENHAFSSVKNSENHAFSSVVDHNSNNANENFRQLYMSQNNVNYIFETVLSSVVTLENQDFIAQRLDTLKSKLFDMQLYIYNDFVKSYDKTKNIDYEKLMIELNRVTFNQFMLYVQKECVQKYNDIQKEYDIQKLYEERLREREERNQDRLRERGDEVRETQREDRETQREERGSEHAEREEIQTKKYFLSSQDATYYNGVHYFDINISNLSSIYIDSLKIKCNMYNINEYNNKIYLLENNKKTPIVIPVGYYSIDKLLHIMETIVNDISAKTSDISAKTNYKFYRNKIKNKVYLTCEQKADEKNEFIRSLCNFGIYFTKNNNEISIGEILGFQKHEYNNNNIYLSENHPNDTSYDDIFIKVYLNKMEIERCGTSNPHFCYYEMIHFNMDQSFGKTINCRFETNQFDIYNPIDVDSIGIELCTHNGNPVQTNFQILVGVEFT
jgi:hypothetical protein